MAKTPELDLRRPLKNYIINGDMKIAQRGTSFTSVANGAYTLDRFIYYKTGAMVHNITQDTDVPTLAQSGYLFQNSLRLTLTTPDTSIAAGDYAAIAQRIEGFNYANFAQKPFTISFWVKATLPGTYCVSLGNSGLDRAYAVDYTISASNTWEYKTITISAPPSAGTWNYANGVGIDIRWTLAAGTTFQTTANAWNTGNFLSTSSQINGVDTGATDFRLTGVCVNEGPDAVSFRLFGGDIGTELIACQRYYEISAINGQFAAAGNNSTAINFSVTKRATPILTLLSGSFSSGSTLLENSGIRGFRLTCAGGGAGAVLAGGTVSAQAEL